MNRRRTYERNMQELISLEIDLETKARSDHKNNKDKIFSCKYCRRIPEHTYDSFGMPMHYLICPKCGREASAAKEYDSVVEEWNRMNKKRKKTISVA